MSLWQKHQIFEKNSIFLLIGVLLVISIGGLVEVLPLFYLKSTIEKVEGMRPYTPLELAGRRDAFARAGEALESVGLSHRGDHYPAQMSGGEQQRVALARAFAPNPRLILADEPTGNLDGETGKAIIDTLFGVRAQRGTTLVLITHEERLAMRCDRIVRMRDGRLDEAALTAAAQ